MLPSVTILEGDVFDRLSDIPDRTVQTNISSPPYWGLRNYKIPPTKWPEIEFKPVGGLPSMTVPPETVCLGLEKDPWSYIAHMVHVYRAVRRTLKDDATIWLNLGDSYSTHGAGAYGKEKDYGASDTRKGRRTAPPGLKHKDLCGMPWRVASALQADGWYFRCDIIWHKPNPMPESAKDRPTKSHEYLFLLSKSARYFYDNKAIEEPASWNTHARRSRADMAHKSVPDQEKNGIRPYKAPDGWDTSKGSGGHGTIHRNGRSKGRKLAASGSENRVKNNDSFEAAMSGLVETRNKRSVWSVCSEPFKEAHFATFPPSLILPCILAGSRPGDTVLDHFLGSGTTCMVSAWNGRKAIGIELSPEYVAMARRRCTPSALERQRLANEVLKLEPLPLFESLEATK